MSYFYPIRERGSIRNLLFHIANNTILSSLDKLENLLDFFAHGNLFGNLDYCILQAEITRIDNAVGVGNVAENTIGNLYLLQHHRIDPVVGSGIATENDVGRYVLLHTATTLDEREATYTHVLLNDYAVTLDRAIVDFALTGNAGSDTDDALIEDVYVVADVGAIHQEVAITYLRGFAFVRATSNDYVLTNTVVVTDDNTRLLSFLEMEILGS